MDVSRNNPRRASITESKRGNKYRNTDNVTALKKYHKCADAPHSTGCSKKSVKRKAATKRKTQKVGKEAATKAREGAKVRHAKTERAAAAKRVKARLHPKFDKKSDLLTAADRRRIEEAKAGRRTKPAKKAPKATPQVDLRKLDKELDEVMLSIRNEYKLQHLSKFQLERLQAKLKLIEEKGTADMKDRANRGLRRIQNTINLFS